MLVIPFWPFFPRCLHIVHLRKDFLLFIFVKKGNFIRTHSAQMDLQTRDCLAAPRIVMEVYDAFPALGQLRVAKQRMSMPRGRSKLREISSKVESVAFPHDSVKCVRAEFLRLVSGCASRVDLATFSRLTDAANVLIRASRRLVSRRAMVSRSAIRR